MVDDGTAEGSRVEARAVNAAPAGLGLETTEELREYKLKYLNSLIDHEYDPDLWEWYLLRDHSRLTSALALASEREATARSEEREACAKIAETPEPRDAEFMARRPDDERDADQRDVGRAMAADAIRARDNPYAAADEFEAWVAEAHEKKGVTP